MLGSSTPSLHPCSLFSHTVLSQAPTSAVCSAGSKVLGKGGSGQADLQVAGDDSVPFACICFVVKKRKGNPPSSTILHFAWLEQNLVVTNVFPVITM